MKTFITISLLFLITSCNLINQIDDGPRYIDPLIKPYLESFLKEASLKGKKINIDHLKMEFKDLKDTQGLSLYAFRTIYIDSTSSGWKNKPECLIFHELGHMFLDRKAHDNTMYGSKKNQPKSIMSSTDDPSFETKKYSYRRAYYVDELFDRNTPEPYWTN